MYSNTPNYKKKKMVRINPIRKYLIANISHNITSHAEVEICFYLQLKQLFLPNLSRHVPCHLQMPVC